MKNKLPFGVLLALVLVAVPAQAQESIKISGQAYVDYQYVLTSPVEEEEGDNGFDYRRLYLTTDFTLSDRFSGRARLEAKAEGSGSDGEPFIKDLYVKWKNPWGEGHTLVVGISSPPSFTVSEKFWGYRSLEKTIMDRNKILSSRDFGVGLQGRLTPSESVRYGVMVANNNSTRGEVDEQKRVYGQLEFYPTDRVSVTVGADYASYDDERDNSLNLNAFAGYEGARFRVGAEGFFTQINLAEAAAKQTAVLADADTDDLFGVAVFAAVRLAEQWEAVARLDQVQRDLSGAETSETFFLAGVAFEPHAKVQFIPNVLVSKEDTDDDPLVTGRVTLHVSF